MALRGKNGEVQGFARVVRDFSKRHSMEEKLRRGGVLLSFSWPKIRRLDGFFK